jgi:hypothetical protein
LRNVKLSLQKLRNIFVLVLRTFCVPDLKLNLFVVQLDGFYLEIDSDGGRVRFDESIVDISKKIYPK